MADRYKDRLKILEDQEIEELYGRPQFNHDERVHFFSLSPEERALADAHYNLANVLNGQCEVGAAIANLPAVGTLANASMLLRRA